ADCRSGLFRPDRERAHARARIDVDAARGLALRPLLALAFLALLPGSFLLEPRFLGTLLLQEPLLLLEPLLPGQLLLEALLPDLLLLGALLLKALFLGTDRCEALLRHLLGALFGVL